MYPVSPDREIRILGLYVEGTDPRLFLLGPTCRDWPETPTQLST